MESRNYYVALVTKQGNDVDEAISRIKLDAVDDIEEIIADCEAEDLSAWLSANECSCVEGIHPMDELDDVFDYMSPTEVLEELGEIDLTDAWFSEYDKCSSDDIFDLMDMRPRDLARMIVGDEIEIDEDDVIWNVLEAMCEAMEAVEQYRKKVETARELFEQAMSNGIDEVISVLWNMNA